MEIEDILSELKAMASRNHDGGFTTKSVSEQIGVGEGAARKMIGKLIDAGKVIPIKVLVVDRWGVSRSTCGYTVAPEVGHASKGTAKPRRGGR